MYARGLKALLLEIHEHIDALGGQLLDDEAETWRACYRAALKQGDLECPPPQERHEGQRGRTKQSKAPNFLERLIEFEEDTLLFMEVTAVPFSNNEAEDDLSITEVQQKISDCFRSFDGACMFCGILSYLSTY